MNAPARVPRTTARTILTGPSYLRALLDCIRTAAHHIDLAVYLMTPPTQNSPQQYAALWQHLLLAPARGVNCRALIHRHRPASPLAFHHNAAAAALAGSGWRCRYALASVTMHSKYWIVDAQHVVIGSHNLTAQANCENVETSIYLHSRDYAMALRDQFAHAWTHQGEPPPDL
jgi:phosphatidylserine/phosphatidylglycerophosphate/cardiolipin synthase-like enzyme